mmetsp:Transcript_66914/g.160230  ORF Transcript_66914/g.160230 Transcript_66914/m.160230 type:complete len:390 (-) Transcript_66914:35-1204(-)
MAQLPAVICDTGTGGIKAGFAGDTEPRVTIPTLLGRADEASGAADAESMVVGEMASAARSTCVLSHPIQHGVVKDWAGMEAIWDHTWERLGLPEDFSELRVVQTEAALNPRGNREKIVEVMFEKYGFGAVNMSVQAILALTARGSNTGFVVDSGDGVTHLVPVTQGYLQPNLVQRMDLAGRQVTSHLMKLLVGQGHPLNARTDFETVREMKQRLCYVAHDFAAEQRLARETTVVDRTYTLPDSRVLRIGAERFVAPEVIFQPGLIGHDGKGLSELVYETIRKSDIDLQKQYFKSIILSGGTTMFPGMSTRLEKDISQLYFEKVLQRDKSRRSMFSVRVDDPPFRQNMVFQGGSILAQAYSSEHPWWITRAEFMEGGAAVIERLIPTKLL